MPLSGATCWACSAVAAPAISGVPPLNGFAGKWLVYQGTLSIENHGLGMMLMVVAVFGIALTLARSSSRSSAAAPRPGNTFPTAPAWALPSPVE